jgi:hypothetical protein
MCGDKFIQQYKKAYVEVLKFLNSSWVTEYEKYLDTNNASGAISEVQNQGFGIVIAGKTTKEIEEATGIKHAITMKRRLIEICVL